MKKRGKNILFCLLGIGIFLISISLFSFKDVNALEKNVSIIKTESNDYYTYEIKDYERGLEYSWQFIKDKAKTNINDDTLKDITTSIKQANEHLLTYFKTLKDEHMSSSNSIMSEINLSYEESYNRNKDMLTFLEILINNYDGSNEMKKNILDYNIKIYQCKDSDNIDEVIISVELL